MTITISVTRILVVMALSLLVCYLFGFTREEAVFSILVSVLFTLFIPPKS